MSKQLPLPPWFNPDNAGVWGFRFDVAALTLKAHEWAKNHNVKPSGSDKVRICLISIDEQDDFCNPEGTLFVAGQSGTGAIDDCARGAEFVYRNMNVITDIKATFDSHSAHQIFYAPFWVGPGGESLNPHTLIVVGQGGSLDNIGLDGTVIHRNVRPRPEMMYFIFGYDTSKHQVKGNYAWLQTYCRYYVEQLAMTNKKALYLWPPHTLVGDPGHAMNGVVRQAWFAHAFARGTHNWAEIKGGLFLTENYSVYKPEVTVAHDGTVVGQRNTALLETIAAYDMTITKGQAKSHCTAESIGDKLDWLLVKDPELAKRVYILEDCMSPVVVGPIGGPGDFTAIADAAIDRFRDAGMHVVKSTDPIQTWPGIPAKLAV